MTISNRTTVYPCDKGTGTPMDYHHFEAGPTGVICCRYCGATPKVTFTQTATWPTPGLPEVYGTWKD
jgi:hypothetical protein